MKIKLDPMLGFVTKEGKFDQRAALIDAGVKAAVCFRGENMPPEEIRVTESEETLIKRGINTILSDHTTPSEHPTIGLEITEIPKALCMVLNNQNQYTADERSLRYTEMVASSYISKTEYEKYTKWLNIFQENLTEKYSDFFAKFNKTPKASANAIKKIAQENARYMVTVFMPTTETYTAPWAQINKIALYMQKFISSKNKTEFQKKLVPYFEDFINQLKDLNVIITNNHAKALCSEIDFPDNDEPLYKNNKHVDLSLFAEVNKFSGIKLPNQYGVSFSYNFNASFACLAQFHRHRTLDFEMLIPEKFEPFIPPLILDDKELVGEWIKDMEEVKPYYPIGQLLNVNVTGSLKNLLGYVGKERACDRAQQEIQNLFTNQLLPDMYNGLVESGQKELAKAVEPYVEKLRCAYRDYKCPTPCGHPRLKRDF